MLKFNIVNSNGIILVTAKNYSKNTIDVSTFEHTKVRDRYLILNKLYAPKDSSFCLYKIENYDERTKFFDELVSVVKKIRNTLIKDKIV